ncbi:hypothetical protein JCM8547_000584, partial [Rhodosporidiobolus lusitaniae]
MGHLPSPAPTHGPSTASLSPSSSSFPKSPSTKPKKEQSSSSQRKGKWSNEELDELRRVGKQFLVRGEEDWEGFKERLGGSAGERSVEGIKWKWKALAKNHEGMYKSEAAGEEDLKVEEEEDRDEEVVAEESASLSF